MYRPESDKLTTVLARSYRALHEADAFRHDGPPAHLDLFRALLADLGDTPRVLDFGCGPRGGLAAVLPGAVGYDPHVPGYQDDPWGRPYDAIYSADVLEHLTVADAGAFLDRVAAAAPALVFLAIATRAAEAKQLDNGLNVHITVMPPAWWYGFAQARLHPDYATVLACGDLVRDECVLAFRRRDRAPGGGDG